MYWGQWPSLPTFVPIYFCNLKHKKIFVSAWMDSIYRDVKNDIVLTLEMTFAKRYNTFCTLYMAQM